MDTAGTFAWPQLKLCFDHQSSNFNTYSSTVDKCKILHGLDYNVEYKSVWELNNPLVVNLLS